MHKHNLTDEEIKRVAEQLAKLEPGYLPTPIFDQVTHLVVISTVVIVILKQTAEGPQVLLRMRGDEPTNPVWPGHWHLPGTMLRPTDKEGDYSDAFARILQEELASTTTESTPHFIRTAFTHTKRGRELTQIHSMIITSDEPLRGEWFSVDDLPKPIIEHEVAYIREAASLLGRLQDDPAVSSLAG